MQLKQKKLKILLLETPFKMFYKIHQEWKIENIIFLTFIL